MPQSLNQLTLKNGGTVQNAKISFNNRIRCVHIVVSIFGNIHTLNEYVHVNEIVQTCNSLLSFFFMIFGNGPSGYEAK